MCDIADMANMADCLGEYGELDVWFATSTPSIVNPPPPKSKTSIEPLASQLTLPCYDASTEKQKLLEQPAVSVVSVVSKDNIVLENSKMKKYNKQTIPQLQPKLKPKLKKCMTPEEYKYERARMHAKKTRERRKAKIQASIEYSTFLHKQNKKLKQQISLLKKQLKELLLLYRQKHCI